MSYFDFNEKIAITTTGGSVCVWTPVGREESQVFTDTNGKKAVLKSDNGSWWDSHKKEAENCFYAQMWLGDYPYGSWCYAIRMCKVTGKVSISEITTDINPRGLSSSERWIQDCKTYVPSLVN